MLLMFLIEKGCSGFRCWTRLIHQCLAAYLGPVSHRGAKKLRQCQGKEDAGMGQALGRNAGPWTQASAGQHNSCLRSCKSCPTSLKGGGVWHPESLPQSGGKISHLPLGSTWAPLKKPLLGSLYSILLSCLPASLYSLFKNCGTGTSGFGFSCWGGNMSLNDAWCLAAHCQQPVAWAPASSVFWL